MAETDKVRLSTPSFISLAPFLMRTGHYVVAKHEDHAIDGAPARSV